MKLVYWLHIKFNIKTKLFGYFGLVFSSLFCFKNNDDNDDDDDLAASLDEFKWETLPNYSIERSICERLCPAPITLETFQQLNENQLKRM